MTEAGAFTEGRSGSGFLAISDPEGDYSSAIEPVIGGDAQGAAAAALIEALRRAGRPGEEPDLVWLTATPDQEEQIIEGLQGVIGLGVPICGETAADNDVAGNWLVFNLDGGHSEAVAVTVMFPSVPLGYAFHSGYQPKQTKGVATRADGRSILEIDGKPGAAVYNDWTDGVVGQAIDRAAMSCSTPPTTRWGAAGMPLPALTTSYSRTPTPSRRQARCRCFPTSEKAM